MHSNDDTDYVFGSANLEVERLTKQHNWVQTCLKDKIVFAPIDLQKPDLKVLDVGCADGILLRDLQKQVSPTAKLVGVDLVAQFLPKDDGNISYAAGSVTEPPAEERVGAFDLTHVRYLLAAAAESGVPKAVKYLADTVAPGGWLQIHEMDVRRPDNTQCKSWVDFITTLGTMFDGMGVGRDFSSKLEDNFKEAGLINVTVEKVKLPAGKKLENEQEARDSLMPFKITIPSLRKAIADLKMDLPEGTLEGLEERFEKEMMEEGAVFTSFIVWGQKPA